MFLACAAAGPPIAATSIARKGPPSHPPEHEDLGIRGMIFLSIATPQVTISAGPHGRGEYFGSRPGPGGFCSLI